MKETEAKRRIEEIWSKVIQYESQPQLVISIDSPHAKEIAKASLAAYATGIIWIDSDAFAPRPQELLSPVVSDVIDRHVRLEFVAVRSDLKGYWAILEEEYEWLVFTEN